MPDSVRARLTLAYAGALALALAAAFTVGYALLAHSLQKRIDESLDASIGALVTLMAEERREGESPAEAAESTVRESGVPDRAVRILDGAGDVLASRDGLLPGASGDAVREFTTEDAGAVARLARAGVAHDGQRYTVVAAVSLWPMRDDLALFRRTALLTVPLVALLAALAAWLLTGHTLAPVVAMCAEARAIGETDLDRRLRVRNPRDELGTLAATFNDLLGRLQASLVRQRGFVADASHELRTPLSIVRSAATMALDRPGRAENEYRTALQVVADESRRLSGLVDDMLTLARADAGHHPVRRAHLCLAELLSDVARAGSLLGAPRGLRVGFAFVGEAPFAGDPDLLRRMVLNLVENAMAHSPADAVVTLDLAGSPDEGWRIRVHDRGPGIPPAERERVFERFYRGEGGAPGGAGLGLAIARWIAAAHGGTLRIQASGPGGTSVVAFLPGQPAAVRAS